MNRGTDEFRRDVIALMPVLRSFAHRFTHSESDVGDLVQETLLKALAHEHQFEPGTNLRAWLFTIMRNTFITDYIRRKRERPLDTADAALDPGHVAATQIWNLRATELQQSIDRLSNCYRDVVVVVILEGLSYEAAAIRLGCPVGTIKSRISRARTLLADAINWGPDDKPGELSEG